MRTRDVCCTWIGKFESFGYRLFRVLNVWPRYMVNVRCDWVFRTPYLEVWFNLISELVCSSVGSVPAVFNQGSVYSVPFWA